MDSDHELGSMKTVVIFTKNNARILVNPEPHVVSMITLPYVVNPDLSKLKHVEPHYWKLKRGKVYPMNFAERIMRSDHVVAYGSDNDIFQFRSKPKMSWFASLLGIFRRS